MKRKRKKSKKSHPTPTRPPAIEAFLAALDQEFQKRRKKVIAPYPYDKQTSTIELPDHIEAELRDLVRQGQKIEAVKRVTRLTGAGLRVSKDYVDGLLSKGLQKKQKR